MGNRRIHIPGIHIVTFCTCMLAVFAVGTVAAQTAPTLADELRTALARGGGQEAQRRFDELWPAQKDRYPYDASEFMQLFQEQTSNADARNALAHINAQLILSVMNDYQTIGTANDLHRAPSQPMESAHAKAEQQAQKRSEAQERGKARDDLERFMGLYGEGARQLAVNHTCDGHLAAAPLWADIAPWRMRSAAASVFTYTDNFLTFSMEFDLNERGRATALRHDLDGMPSPMRRTGDLPPQFRECLPPPTR